jgi:hypothetical protein
MRSLVEAVANVLLFILAPVALVWVQSRIAMAIEALGKLPMETNEARVVYRWVGNHEQSVLELSSSCLAQTAAERK